MGDECRCAEIQEERTGFDTWPGQYVVFLGKTFYFHTVSLHPEKRVPANCQGRLMKCLGGEVILRWANYNIPFKG